MERDMQQYMGKAQEQFERFADKVMRVYDAAGMAVSIFDRQTILYEKYFGYRNVGKRLPLDGGTIFGMASVSKSFTALSIMQLEEAGKLGLEDPVSKYIPEFYDDRVKISHLLTHSAGYFPLKRILVKGVPGQYMSYSNDGYGILSEIIHRLGGERSYGEYVQKHIFEPLGMERSFCEFIKPSKDPNGTELYIHRNGSRESSRDFYDNAFVLMGGGAVKSTVRDMRRYVRMYLLDGKIPGSGERIVSRCSIQEMCRPRQEYHYGEWYGYGLAEKRIAGMTVWGHGGSLTGISNYMAWEPRLGIGVLVFCNTTGVPVSRVAEMAFRMAGGLLMEEEPFIPVVSWSETLMERAAGTYISGEGVKVTLEKAESRMKMKVNGEPMRCRMILPGILETEESVGYDQISERKRHGLYRNRTKSCRGFPPLLSGNKELQNRNDWCLFYLS